MIIVALDLSLRGTGIADDDGCATVGFSLKRDAHWTEHADRLRKLGQAIDRFTKGADLVVIESPAYAQASAGNALGELHGVVKVLLFQRDRRAVYATTQQMKKFATGKGGAGKDDVLAAAIHSGSPARNHNESDAWWLRQMALHHYSRDRDGLPMYRKAVLAAIPWPVIDTMKEAVHG